MRVITTVILVLVFAGALLTAGVLWPAHRTPNPNGQIIPPEAVASQTAEVSNARTLEYDIGGMHCDGCAEAITAEVKEVNGVESVLCQFSTHNARICLRDPAVQPQVEHAITKLGYTITLASSK